MIWSHPSSRQHTMDMRMKQQSLIPCVQHAEEPDLRSEMARISSHFEQRLGSTLRTGG